MSDTRRTTPWLEWMRRAAQMGVPPEAFWKLSLKEWRALAAGGAHIQGGRMQGRELSVLIARYPDGASAPDEGARR